MRLLVVLDLLKEVRIVDVIAVEKRELAAGGVCRADLFQEAGAIPRDEFGGLVADDALVRRRNNDTHHSALHGALILLNTITQQRKAT